MSGAELVTTRVLRAALGLFFGLALVVIYLPLAVMMLFSFNSGRYQTLPFREPTLQWYVRMAQDGGFVERAARAGHRAGAQR